MQPLIKAMRTFIDDPVALGMRDDGLNSSQEHFVKHIVHLLRDKHVGELNEEIFFAVDGVFRWVLVRVLNVFVGQMKVAAETEHDFVANPSANLLQLLLVYSRIELVSEVGMGGAGDVRDAVGRGHFYHGDRHLQAF